MIQSTIVSAFVYVCAYLGMEGCSRAHLTYLSTSPPPSTRHFLASRAHLPHTTHTLSWWIPWSTAFRLPLSSMTSLIMPKPKDQFSVPEQPSLECDVCYAQNSPNSEICKSPLSRENAVGETTSCTYSSEDVIFSHEELPEVIAYENRIRAYSTPDKIFRSVAYMYTVHVRMYAF